MPSKLAFWTGSVNVATTHRYQSTWEKSRFSASVDCDVAGRYAPPLPPDPARLALCGSVGPGYPAYTDVARKGLCMWLALVIRLCCDRLKNCWYDRFIVNAWWTLFKLLSPMVPLKICEMKQRKERKWARTNCLEPHIWRIWHCDVNFDIAGLKLRVWREIEAYICGGFLCGAPKAADLFLNLFFKSGPSLKSKEHCIKLFASVPKQITSVRSF